MTRSKAFVLHLLVSLAVLLVPLYFAWYHWYTPVLFRADGGLQGFRLLAILFLLLGPGLTLLLFKPGKRGLWYDMVIVLLLQTGILGWGSWTLYRERPVAIVYADGYFIPVTAYQLKEAGLPAGRLDTLDKTRPARIYVDLPQETEQLQHYRARALATLTPMYLFTDRYRRFDQAALMRVRQRGLDMEKLFAEAAEDYQTWQSFIQKNPHRQGKMIYVPLHARYKRQILVVDADNGEIIASLDIVPSAFIEARHAASQVDVRWTNANHVGWSAPI